MSGKEQAQQTILEAELGGLETDEIPELSKKLFSVLSDLEFITSNEEASESIETYHLLKELISKLSSSDLRKAMLMLVNDTKKTDDAMLILFHCICFVGDEKIENFPLEVSTKRKEEKYLKYFYDMLCHNGRSELIRWLTERKNVPINKFLEVPNESHFAPIDFAIFKGHYNVCKLLVVSGTISDGKVGRKTKNDEEDETEGEEEEKSNGEDEKKEDEFVIDQERHSDLRSTQFIDELNGLNPKFRFSISVEDLCFRSNDHRMFLARLQKGIYPHLKPYLNENELGIRISFSQKPNLSRWGPPLRLPSDRPPYKLGFGLDRGVSALSISFDPHFVVPRSAVLQKRYPTDQFYRKISKDILGSYYFYKSTRKRILNFLSSQFTELFSDHSCHHPKNDETTTSSNLKIADHILVEMSPKSEFQTHEMWNYMLQVDTFSQKIRKELPAILHRLKEHKKKLSSTSSSQHDSSIKSGPYKPFKLLLIKLRFDTTYKSRSSHSNNIEDFVYYEDQNHLEIELNVFKVSTSQNGWTDFYDRLYMTYFPQHELRNFLPFSYSEFSPYRKHRSHRIFGKKMMYVHDQKSTIDLPSISDGSKVFRYDEETKNQLRYKIFKGDVTNRKLISTKTKVYQTNDRLGLELEVSEPGDYSIKFYNVIKYKNEDSSSSEDSSEEEIEFLIGHDLFEVFEFQFTCYPKKEVVGFIHIRLEDKKMRKYHQHISSVQFLTKKKRKIKNTSNKKKQEEEEEIEGEHDDDENEEIDVDEFGSSIILKKESVKRIESKYISIPSFQKGDGYWKLIFDDTISEHFKKYGNFNLSILISYKINDEKTRYVRYNVRDILFISELGITEKVNGLKSDLKMSSISSTLHIDRKEILKSSMDQLDSFHGPNFRNRKFKISFLNEMGSDAGGLRRSWWSLLMKEVIKSCVVICSSKNNNQNYRLNELVCDELSEEKLKYCEFMGKCFAKMIIMENSCPLHVQLGLGLFKILLWNDDEEEEEFRLDRLGLPDLPYLDEGLGKRFDQLSQLSEEELEMCRLNFVYFDKKKGEDVELIPNGENVYVTKDSFDRFVSLYIRKKFSYLIQPKSEEERERRSNEFKFASRFRQGFYNVIPSRLIRSNSFRSKDLLHLIEGDPSSRAMDVKTVLSVTRFDKESSVSIRDFMRTKNYWLHLFHETKGLLEDYPELIESKKKENQSKNNLKIDMDKKEFLENLLFFFTGYFHLPSFGFKEKLVVRIVTSNGNQFRLPTAHTCVFQISLPVYKNYMEFIKALSIVINCGFNGFGFQ